jgi:WD40 repeat protein
MRVFNPRQPGFIVLKPIRAKKVHPNFMIKLRGLVAQLSGCGPHRLKPVPLVALGLVAFACFAVETRVWQHSEQADFSRGTAEHISLSSDGRLTLAPSFRELFDGGVPYLWSVVRDSKGTVYCAGGAPTGATTRVFSVSPSGKSKTFAELTGLEVHVLALDSKDRLYAAVLPDAKIYRIDASGKSEMFFDTQQKYVWAMAFDKAGNLFVATGDSGIIYKVTPDGKGAVFYRTDESHARSMIIDAAGNLIVGTEPSGLVLRITPKGEGFVLFQTAKREVTAVAEHDGVYYAASVGQRVSQAPSPVQNTPSQQPTPTPATLPQHSGITVVPSAQQPPAALPPPLAAASGGGSEFYRIEANGYAQRLWASATEIVYAISFDSHGHPLLATGNKGVIYRVDSSILSTELLTAAPTQVTGFASGPDGIMYAVTGNLGKLYAIGPDYAQTGTLESDVLDANGFNTWGKAHVKTESHGGSIQLETRSGNLSRPQKDWSEWKRVDLNPNGGQVASPPARFLQYRLTLNRGPHDETPEVSSVEIAYQEKNVAPLVHAIEVESPNYRLSSGMVLERQTLPSGSPATLVLPPIGQKRTQLPSTLDGSAGVTLQYAKGFMTARWNATDENGDALIYQVEIRGKGERNWRLLRDKLTEKQFSWDTTAFPDGEYRLRVTASDAPSNTAEGALSASLEGDPFVIDNTPPEILNSKTNGNVITFTAKDALSWIDKAEYSVDGADWKLLEPVNGVTDSQVLDYRLTLPTTSAAERVVAVRVFDEADNVVVVRFLVP